MSAARTKHSSRPDLDEGAANTTKGKEATKP